MIVSAPVFEASNTEYKFTPHHLTPITVLQYYSFQKAKTMDFQHLCQAKTIKNPLYEPKNRFHKL